jgi:hypothetical protein
MTINIKTQFCSKTPCNPVFNVLHTVLPVVLQCQFSGPIFGITGARIEPTISLAGCNHLHVIRSRVLRFIFAIYCRYKVKNGKKFKTLQQNNALREKAAPDRAH